MVKLVADRPKASKVSPEPGDLKTLPMSALEAKLESSTEGLSQDEASKRLKHYGPNEIKEEKTNPYLKFLSYFWGPIPWMIEVAVILSGLVGHWPDFFIIRTFERLKRREAVKEAEAAEPTIEEKLNDTLTRLVDHLESRPR